MGAEPSGPPVDATVKWFNGEKGFGFVELSDGSGDAFLHIGVVQASGHDEMLPETKLRVQVGQGQKGRQVTNIVEHLGGGNANAGGGGGGGGGGYGAPRGPRPGGGAPRGGGRERADPSTAVPLEGTVKWFKSDKGFGFVGADDGGKDVFIHISVLERAGLGPMSEGQRVSMQVVTTQKGREAISLRLI